MKKLVFLAIFALAMTLNLKGQFIQLNTGENNDLSVITHHNGNIFIGDFNKILKSSDNGVTWQTVLLLNVGDITHIVFNGSNGLASSRDRLFHSSDNGNSWAIINLPDSIQCINEISFRNQFEAYVLATKPGGSACGGLVFKSILQGTAWTTTVPFFTWSDYEPTAMCWRNDTAFMVIRLFNGISCQNKLVKMNDDFSIAKTWSLQPAPLFYAKKVIWDGSNFIIFGTNSFGALALLQKNESYETAVPYSSGIDGIMEMVFNEANNQAILCGTNGKLIKISTIGNTSSNAITPITTGVNAALLGLCLVNNNIYSVGYQGILITNNTNLGTDDANQNLLGINCQNPFSNDLNLTGSLTGNVKIYSIDGKLVFQEEKTSENLNIKTDNFPTGIYLLEINTNGKKIMKKLVKK